MEVPPQAEGGERLDMELVRSLRCPSCRQLANQGTELIFPALSDNILHCRSIVSEIVGDLDGPSKLDLLVPSVRRE